MADTRCVELVQGRLTVVAWENGLTRPELANAWFPIMQLADMVPWLRSGGDPIEHPIVKAVVGHDLRVIRKSYSMFSHVTGLDACIDDVTPHYMTAVDFVSSDVRTQFAKECAMLQYGSYVTPLGVREPIYHVPRCARMFKTYDDILRSCIHDIMGLHISGTESCAACKTRCKAPLLVLSTDASDPRIMRKSVITMRIDSVRSAIRSTAPPYSDGDSIWRYSTPTVQV